jgi:hypothetical protein
MEAFKMARRACCGCLRRRPRAVGEFAASEKTWPKMSTNIFIYKLGTYSAVIDNMLYILGLPPQVVFVSSAVSNTNVVDLQSTLFYTICIGEK